MSLSPSAASRLDVPAWIAEIVDASEEAIALETLDGTLAAWNPAAERLFGYTAREALGQPSTLVVPPERRTEHEGLLARVHRGESVELPETVRRTQDGRELRVLLRASPILDGSRTVIGASTRIRVRALDPRDRIEGPSWPIQDRFRTLADLAPVGIFLTDADGACQYVNQAWQRFAGLTAEEATGFGWTRALHPDDRERVANEWQDAVRSRQPFTSEYRFQRPDGTVTWLQGSAAELVDHGRVVEHIGTLSDITARKRAENAVQEREDLLRLAQRTVQAGVWALDPAGGQVHWSPECHALHGTDPGRFLPSLQSWAALVMPEDRPGALQAVQRALQGQQELSLEFRIEHPERGLRWLWANGHVQRADDGRPLHMLGITIDITERKQAEEALRESERLYRAIGESIDYGIWICDVEGHNTYASPSFLELLGVTQDKCSELRWMDTLHPDDAAATLAAWQDCVRRGALWEREHRFLGADGRLHFVLARGVPIRDERGAITCWAGINLDIGRLKRAEEAARSSEERLRLALRGANAGVWFVDLVTGECLWSEELRSLYGHAPSAPASYAGWLAKVHPDDHQRVASSFRDWVASNASEFRQEFRIVHPQRGVRSILDMGVIERDPRGAAIRTTGIDVDITDRVAAEQALRVADQRKDEFLATLGHELRNPLAPIVNALHLLQRGELRAELRERALAMMGRQVNHLVRLVDDLLELSRITRGAIELRTERIDLAHIISSAVDTSRPLIEAGAHQLEIQLPDAPLLLDADPVRLAQVLSNLLANAAKYTDPGGRLRLAARRDGDALEITVQDNGVGIPVEMLPRVFELFAQVDRTLKRSQGGLGIGLSLARKLIEMHGGSIEARSEGPSRGSEFIVRLPIRPEVSRPHSPEHPPRAEPPEKLTPAPHRRILVVDDNTDAAQSLAALLQILGHEVELAYDGDAALQQAAVQRPEVVLLDLSLPGIDGLEVARRLRRQPGLEQLLIVALTGHGQPQHRLQCQEAGFDAHLLKPVELPELDALLRGSAHGLKRDGQPHGA